MSSCYKKQAVKSSDLGEFELAKNFFEEARGFAKKAVLLGDLHIVILKVRISIMELQNPPSGKS